MSNFEFDELQETIASLQAQLEDAEQDAIEDSRTIQDMAEQLMVMEAELIRARQDTARWQWIKQMMPTYFENLQARMGGYDESGNLLISIDEAIDRKIAATREAQQKEKENV